MSETRPLLVELTFTAKSYDIDYAGIVNNAVYIRWLEDLRLQLLQQHFPLNQQVAQNQSPVLERTEIVYRRPLRLLDQPVGRMWVSNLARARWEIEAEFELRDLTIATAKQSGYFVDLERIRPIRIPEEIRMKWEEATRDL